MLEGKALVQDSDMPAKMQLQAMSTASEALDHFDVLNCKSIATHLEKVSHQEFDRKYGPGWQCVVGPSFSCFFTHTQGDFIYFCLESLTFLIFKATASEQQSIRTECLSP